MLAFEAPAWAASAASALPCSCQVQCCAGVQGSETKGELWGLANLLRLDEGSEVCCRIRAMQPCIVSCST